LVVEAEAVVEALLQELVVEVELVELDGWK